MLFLDFQLNGSLIFSLLLVGWIGGGTYAVIVRFKNPLQRGRGVGDVAIGFALAVALPLALDPNT